MQLHEIKAPFGAKKRRKIVGRGPGSDHGKTSCRGQKGQKSRSGKGRIMIGLEGGQMPLIRRLPKVGFRSKRPILNQIVSLESLNCFDQGTVVTVGILKSHGLINSLNKPYKILSEGDIKKSLIIQGGSISRSAAEKILKAGGKIVPEAEAATSNSQTDAKIK